MLAYRICVCFETESIMSFIAICFIRSAFRISSICLIYDSGTLLIISMKTYNIIRISAVFRIFFERLCNFMNESSEKSIFVALTQSSYNFMISTLSFYLLSNLFITFEAFSGVVDTFTLLVLLSLF